MALAVAKKVKGVVRTESPGWTPAATSASHNASVPEAQPTTSPTLRNAAASRSNPATSFPKINCCESQRRAITARISSRKGTYCRCKSSSGTRMWAFDDASAAGLDDTALVMGAMQKQTNQEAKLDCSPGQKTGPQFETEMCKCM